MVVKAGTSWVAFTRTAAQSVGSRHSEPNLGESVFKRRSSDLRVLMSFLFIHVMLDGGHLWLEA